MPNAHSSANGIQPLIAPMLVSHFPMFRPTMLSVTAIVRPATAKMVTYVAFVPSACTDGPPTNAPLAAANNSSVGKYGRFVVQYIQPVMKPANGPNARLLQT